MKTLSTPREVPSKRHYFYADDAHAFRLPSLGKTAQLLRISRTVQSVTADRLLENENLPNALAAIGVVIGACWYHPTLDLEAGAPPVGTDASLLAYGDRVFEELHEAGYSIGQIQALWTSIVEHLVRSVVSDTEVEARAGFSEAPTEA